MSIDETKIMLEIEKNAKKRKSILVITPRYLFPVVGGDRLRVYEICRALSTSFDLELLSITDEKTVKSPSAADLSIFKGVHSVFLPRWRSYLNVAIALIKGTSLQVAYYQAGAVRQAVIKLLERNDGILAHLIRVADYAKETNKPKFLEMTDAISMNYEKFMFKKARFRSLKSFIFALEGPRVKRYERNICAAFDDVFLVSEIDRKFLGEEISNIIVSSNGVSTKKLPYIKGRCGNEIIFIGNMQSVQNLDAAHFLCREILPKVREKIPNATAKLIGRISEAEASKLASYPGVVVTGEVEIVAEAARSGTVAICPVRLGAGVQNKVLEYFSLGLPVVCTPLGLEGIQALPGQHLMLGETAEELGSALTKLLLAPNLRDELSAGGRLLVEEHYSWQQRLHPLVDAVRRRMQRPI